MPSIVLIAGTCILVLAFGGFFSLQTCLVGTVVCIVAAIAWLRKPLRSEGIPIVALLLLGMVLVYTASTFANGTSLTTLSETGAWAACAGAAFLAAAQDVEKRATWVKVLAWFGVATAAAGIVLCTGLVPLSGGMVAERLQFTFQYANAAAAWYGICSFLCLFSPDNRQRAFSALPLSALFLTESGGGMVVFALVVAVVCVYWTVRKNWSRLFHSLVQGVLAIALFAVVRATMSPVALIGLIAAILLCLLLMRDGDRIGSHIDNRIGSIVLMVVAVACVVAAVILFPERVAGATDSLGERAHHVKDGLALWAAHPLLGVGPDNWQYLYSQIQTAPYYTTVVHCSYVQIMLDAGIVGIVFFVAACAVGTIALVRDWKARFARKGWESAELIAALFLLAHSLLDFDLQFAALTFALTIFLSSPNGPKLSVKQVGGLLAGLACVLVCLLACVTGLLCASSSSALELSESSGDYASCEQFYESNPLAQSDIAAQSHYLAALYGEGKYGQVIAMYGRMIAPSDRDTFNAALACYAMQDLKGATNILIRHLDNHPYSTAFLNGALQLADAYGVDPMQEGAFNSAVENARSMSQI